MPNSLDWRKQPGAAQYVDLIESVAKENDIDPEVFGAQLFQESGFNPVAVSKDGAQGIAQIMPALHPDVENPFNAEESIKYAGKFMARNLERFDGDYDAALASYHSGPARVASLKAKFGGAWATQLGPEGQNYIDRLSPARVEYPLAAAKAVDEKADMQKRIDALKTKQVDRKTKLANMRAEMDATEEVAKEPQQSWFSDYGKVPARAMFGTAQAIIGGVSAISDAVTERFGDLRINIGNGRPVFEALSPDEVSAQHGKPRHLTDLIAPQERPKDATDFVQQGIGAVGGIYGESERTGAKVSEGILQFAMSMYATKNVAPSNIALLKSSPRLAKILGGLIHGSEASFIGFEGDSGNLASLIEATKNDATKFPDVSNSFTAMLAGDENDSELMLRWKNAVTDAFGGVVAEGLIGIVKKGRAAMKAKADLKAAHAAEAADVRPEMNLDKVKVASEDLPTAPTPDAPAAPAKASDDGFTVSDPVAEVAAHNTIPDRFILPGSVVLKHESGHIAVTPMKDGALQITSAAGTSGARAGAGRRLVLRAVQYAAEQGKTLHLDQNVSNEMLWPFKKLRDEGKITFTTDEAKFEEALATGGRMDGNVPQISNIQAVEPHAPKIDVEIPKAGETPKPLSETPLEDSVADLSKRLGITDELVESIRAKLTSGEVKPEQVGELIGINGGRIDWSLVKSPEDMVGMLNTISRLMDDVVGGAARYSRVSVRTVENLASQIGASSEEAFDLFNKLKASGGIEARVHAARIALNASAAKLMRLARKVVDGTASPEETLELALHDRRHYVLQATVRGIKAMVARSLRMMRENAAVDESVLTLTKGRAERKARAARDGLERAKRKRDAAVRKSKPRADGTPASDANVVKEEVAVEQAERLLKETQNAGRQLSATDVEESLKKLGYSPRDIQKLAKRLSEAQTVEAVHTATRVGQGLGIQSRLATLYINNLLSGFPTINLNILSGAYKVAESSVERYGSALVGMVRGGDKYTWIAAHRAVVATRVAWQASWKIAGKAFVEGLPQTDLIARHEAAEYTAFKPLSQSLDSAGSAIGTVITAPSRVIMTIDEFFKSIFYQQELAARATEVAAEAARLFPKGSKMAKDMFENEFRKLMDNPPDDLRLDAIENARYQTFQKGLESKAMQNLTHMLNETPMLKLVVPFVRTPSNIVKQAVMERTPLAFATRSFYRALAAGGRTADTAIFRAVLATTAAGVFFDAALDGRLVGSQQGRGANRNSADLGVLPYSIKFGDTWYQYNRLDPYGTTLGLIADTADLYHDYRLRSLNETEVDDPTLLEAFGNTLGILSENITDKTFFTGISGLVKAVEGGDDAPAMALQYVEEIGKNLIPFSSAQRNIARSHDAMQREAWTFMDRIKSQTPGFREELPIRRDYLGRSLPETQRLGPDILSPIQIAKDDPDPVAKAFADLEMSYRMPDKMVDGVQLTAQQYSRVCAVRGEFIYDQISRRISNDDWYNRTRGQRTDMVRAWAEEGTAKAKSTILRETDKDGAKSLRNSIKSREQGIDALRALTE